MAAHRTPPSSTHEIRERCVVRSQGPGAGLLRPRSPASAATYPLSPMIAKMKKDEMGKMECLTVFPHMPVVISVRGLGDRWSQVSPAMPLICSSFASSNIH